MKLCRICKTKLSKLNSHKSHLVKRDYICIDCIKVKNKTYNTKNKTKISDSKKKYYHKNKERIHNYQKEYFKDNLKSWEGFIPIETNCQICNTKIYFNRKNRKTAICFDHKKETIINSKPGPTFWLGQHKRTLENEKIWKKCNFGMLCSSCNAFLPTERRKEYIRKVIKYVFSKKLLTY